MSGVLQQSMGDQANLLDICNVREGFVAYKFAELNNLTAAGVGEGAALIPATVTPESVRIVATPQEVPAIQITNLAMETQEVDWINLSGALGKALGDRANALVCATFDDTFGAAGVRECANSTDGGGNPAAMDIHTLELALEIAEGNNKLSKSFGGPGNLAFVLHPSQVSALRAAVRASSNYISREDILATFPALSGNGVAFGYYGVPVISSAGVVLSAFANAAGGGTELQTGVIRSAESAEYPHGRNGLDRVGGHECGRRFRGWRCSCESLFGLRAVGIMSADAYMLSSNGRQRLVVAADVADYQGNGWTVVRYIEVEKAPAKPKPKKKAPAKKKAKAED
jgi:hypothetical protein